SSVHVMPVASGDSLRVQASVRVVGTHDAQASEGFTVPAATPAPSITHDGGGAAAGGQSADVPVHVDGVPHGPSPARHVVPAPTKRHSASQQLEPAGPASQSSPGWTMPSPQPGIFTSATLLARFGSSSRLLVSTVTRSVKARRATSATPVTSRYWHGSSFV